MKNNIAPDEWQTFLDSIEKLGENKFLRDEMHIMAHRVTV